MKRLLSFFFIIMSAPAFSQKQASNWFFGAYAGISFATNPPTALTSGQINTIEGCASISNKQGELLFYTDGVTIWNRKHQQMANGSNLKGNYSSSQSAIIVPYPGYSNKYFLFTVDAAEHQLANGFTYSVIDMNKQSGLGEVIIKNVPLLDTVAEKITAVKHANNHDFWVIVQRWGTNGYYAYLISSAGVNPKPVITYIGETLSGLAGRGVGNMKMSPDGKRLVSVYSSYTKAELLDFNSQTGILSNLITINSHSKTGIYGVEFSPDSKKLYIADYGESTFIWQYNLRGKRTSGDILHSATVIGQARATGALQLGPDGKIYIASRNSDSLGVIEKPNNYGLECQYHSGAIYLKCRKSKLGLPNFISSFFEESNISFRGICYKDTTFFNVTLPEAVDSIRWNFNDPATGLKNTSRTIETFHIYQAVGTYKPFVILYLDNGDQDTLYENIHITNGLKPQLGPDREICNGSTFTFNLPDNFSFVRWSTSEQDTMNSLTVTQSGTYVVTAKGGQCFNSDTVKISFLSPEQVLPKQITFCQDDSILLDAGNKGYMYSWSNGDTTQRTWIKQSGQYTITLSTGTCSWRDTVMATQLTSRSFSLGNDTAICSGQVLPLEITLAGTQYIWSTGQTSSGIAVTQQGVYIASVRTTCGFISDTLAVHIVETPIVALDTLKRMCNTPIDLDAGNPGYTYQWSTGENTQHIKARDLGDYQVTIFNGSCAATSNFIVKSGCPVRVWMPNAFTPNADNLNDVFTATTTGEITQFSLEIYNHWGEKIFVSNSLADGWDGTFRGQNCPDGAYFWKLSCIGYNAAINQSGSVTLLR